MQRKGGKHKNQLKSGRNKRSGKYVRQFLRTAANLKRKGRTNKKNKG